MTVKPFVTAEPYWQKRCDVTATDGFDALAKIADTTTYYFCRHYDARLVAIEPVP